MRGKGLWTGPLLSCLLPHPQPRLHLPFIPLHQAPAGDALRAPLLPRHHALAQHLQGESQASCPRPTPPARTPDLSPAWPGPISALLPFRTAPTTGASLRGWPITSTTLSTRPRVSGFGDSAPPASLHSPLAPLMGLPSASFSAYGAQQVKLALAIFVVSRLAWGMGWRESGGFWADPAPLTDLPGGQLLHPHGPAGPEASR